jgi:hypothetical protein
MKLTSRELNSLANQMVAAKIVTGPHAFARAREAVKAMARAGKIAHVDTKTGERSGNTDVWQGITDHTQVDVVSTLPNGRVVVNDPVAVHEHLEALRKREPQKDRAIPNRFCVYRAVATGPRIEQLESCIRRSLLKGGHLSCSMGNNLKEFQLGQLPKNCPTIDAGGEAVGLEFILLSDSLPDEDWWRQLNALHQVPAGRALYFGGPSTDVTPVRAAEYLSQEVNGVAIILYGVRYDHGKWQHDDYLVANGTAALLATNVLPACAPAIPPPGHEGTWFLGDGSHLSGKVVKAVVQSFPTHHLMWHDSTSGNWGFLSRDVVLALADEGNAEVLIAPSGKRSTFTVATCVIIANSIVLKNRWPYSPWRPDAMLVPADPGQMVIAESQCGSSRSRDALSTQIAFTERRVQSLRETPGAKVALHHAASQLAGLRTMQRTSSQHDEITGTAIKSFVKTQPELDVYWHIEQPFPEIVSRASLEDLLQLPDRRISVTGVPIRCACIVKPTSGNGILVLSNGIPRFRE